MGPLLFTAYVRPVSSSNGYPDDTQFYHRFSPRDPQSLLNAIRTLEKCIDEVKKWMLANKLKLNDSKTEFIVFVNKHNLSFIHDKSLVIMVGETEIPPKILVLFLTPNQQ